MTTTSCEICRRYGMTTQATTTRIIEQEYGNNKVAAPVCAECATQICPICETVDAPEGVCIACQEEIDGQDGFAECAYCGCDVPTLTYQEACQAGWNMVAEEHAKDCEWVLTRAHTL